MLQRIILTITIISLIVLSLFLVLTTPATVGPFGLLVIFISAYVSFLGIISFFLWGISKIVVYLSTGFTLKKPLQPMTFRRAYYFSTILAAAPVMLIGLQSVGSVGIYELILVIIFEVVGCVYIAKRIY